MRRHWLKVILSLAAILGLVAAAEYFRPRTSLDGPPPPAVERRSETSVQPASPTDPEAFLKELKKRYVAMDERYRSLEHTETVQAFDRSGDVERPVRRAVERVWYTGTKEMRQAIKDPQPSEAQTELPRFVLPVAKERDSTLLYPFTRPAEPDAYRYSLEGEDVLDGRRVFRVRFEPAGTDEHKLRGVVWADAKTAEPLRFDGIVCRPKMFVDSVRYITEYGPSENDAQQIRLIRVEGAGGFAVVRRRFRVDIAMSDYRPRLAANDGRP
jgi:hypothetical protein